MKLKRIKSIMLLFTMVTMSLDMMGQSIYEQMNSYQTNSYKESFNDDDEENEDDEEKNNVKMLWAHRNQGNFVYVGTGYGYIGSEIIHDWPKGNPNNGFEWQVGYEWISKNKIGIGAFYSGYMSTARSYYRYTILLNYIAPQFVVKIGAERSKWSFAAGIGAGLSNEYEILKDPRSSDWSGSASRSKCGLGINASLRVEFAPSEQFRIYAMLSRITCFISQKDLDRYSDKKIGGFDRLSIAIGVMHQF